MSGTIGESPRWAILSRGVDPSTDRPDNPRPTGSAYRSYDGPSAPPSARRGPRRPRSALSARSALPRHRSARGLRGPGPEAAELNSVGPDPAWGTGTGLLHGREAHRPDIEPQQQASVGAGTEQARGSRRCARNRRDPSAGAAVLAWCRTPHGLALAGTSRLAGVRAADTHPAAPTARTSPRVRGVTRGPASTRHVIRGLDMETHASRPQCRALTPAEGGTQAR
jgi:hypothetical protein